MIGINWRAAAVLLALVLVILVAGLVIEVNELGCGYDASGPLPLCPLPE